MTSETKNGQAKAPLQEVTGYVVEYIWNNASFWQKSEFRNDTGKMTRDELTMGKLMVRKKQSQYCLSKV